MINLPKKCFISHSYKDKDAVQPLRRHLPKGIKSVIFRPIRVTSNEMVTSKLIEHILGCGGLIYFRGGKTENSFWVAFERDYALRAGLRVFVFDSSSGEITPDESKPIKIRVFPIYAYGDQETAFRLLRFMEEERFFGDMFYDRANLDASSHIHSKILDEIRKRLDDGGYILLFWSHRADKSEYVQAFINLVSQDEDYSDRVLVVALTKDKYDVENQLRLSSVPTDASPFKPVEQPGKEWLRDKTLYPLYKEDRGFIHPHLFWGGAGYGAKPPTDRDPIRRARLIQGIRLREDRKPGSHWALPEGTDQNRLDDLIVQLYWHLFKNTKFKNLD